MAPFRFLLRLLIFVCATVVFAFLLLSLVYVLGILVFDSPTPECRTNDSCNTFGNIVYPVQESWLAFLAWFALCGLLLLWPFRWVIRSNHPVRH